MFASRRFRDRAAIAGAISISKATIISLFLHCSSHHSTYSSVSGSHISAALLIFGSHLQPSTGFVPCLADGATNRPIWAGTLDKSTLSAQCLWCLSLSEELAFGYARFKKPLSLVASRSRGELLPLRMATWAKPIDRQAHMSHSQNRDRETPLDTAIRAVERADDSSGQAD